MKNLILSIVFLLITFVGYGQSSKTLIRSFNVNTEQVSVEVDCKKTILVWDKTYVRIEMIVTTNFRYEILDVLVKNGRYNFESKMVNQTLTIFLPNTKEKVKIGEIELIENFEIKIWLPSENNLKNGLNL